jgi:hypothetical protein
MSNKTGIGIPSNQSRMYPAAAASLIFCFKCISDCSFLWRCDGCCGLRIRISAADVGLGLADKCGCRRDKLAAAEDPGAHVSSRLGRGTQAS